MWAVAAVVVAGIGYGLMPRPVPADLEHVTRGELRVTVNEDGKTRIKDRYLVSSPLSGQLLRVELEPGDSVVAMKTVVAQLQPDLPSNLDARTLMQAEAKFKMSELTLQRATLTEQTAQKAMLNAQKHLDRIQKLKLNKAATDEDLEAAELDDSRRREEYNASKLAVDIARFEMEWARLAMWQVQPPTSQDDSAGATPDAKQNYDIFAPISGKVLRKLKESATPITAGTSIVEVGDPQRLEMEIDVLSSDAVQIPPQARVIVNAWGGEHPLHGIVRVVEPAAFTKISALGVEEQRVYVLCDLIDPPAEARALGDRFRVEVRVAVWHRDDVLVIPAGALFREGSSWKTFVFRDGKAKSVAVEAGKTDGRFTEVLSGLEAGDEVLLHPPDTVKDGSMVKKRSP